MIGIRMAAPLKVGRERVSQVWDPSLVKIFQPRLPAIRVRQPAEEVIEGPILHHDPDNVLDA